MDTQPIVTQITRITSQAFEACKSSTLWFGHTIKTSFITHVIPASQKISQLATTAFSYLQKQLQSNPGFIFVIAGGLLLAGITAFKLADRKEYEEDIFTKAAWKSTGIITFVFAMTLTSIGMIAIFSL